MHYNMVNLIGIMLKKSSQSQNRAYCMISLIWHSRKDRTFMIKIKSVIVRGGGKEVWLQKDGTRVIWVSVMKSYVDGDGGRTNLYMQYSP